jgi:Protein kinase domain
VVTARIAPKSEESANGYLQQTIEPRVSSGVDFIFIMSEGAPTRNNEAASVGSVDSEATTPLDLRVGKTIGDRYQLASCLGQGGFGAVYRARDTLLDRQVAIKLINANLTGDMRARYLREARATARLHHPNVVTLFDAGDDSVSLYLVLELVEGSSLRQIVARGALPEARARAIALQIANALAAAHAQGITHRDIKPENILVAAGDVVKIADFGIAQLAGESRLTAVGGIVGTPRYMSPEQLEGRTVGAASDLFAFGCVLYEMLAGSQPFGGIGISEIASRIVNGKWEPPPGAVAKAPELWALVATLLQNDPAKRGTALEAAAQLEGRPRPARFSRRGFVVAAAALLLVLVAALWWRAGNGRSLSTLNSMRIHLARAPVARVLELAGASRAGGGTTRAGMLAGIPLQIAPIGSGDVQLFAAPSDLARAANCVRLIDALHGYSFATEPNLFTGDQPSTRKISVEGSYRAADLITLIAAASGWPVVSDPSVQNLAQPVTTQVRDASWDEVVKSILDRQALVADRDADVWLLATRKRAAELQDVRQSIVYFQMKRDPHELLSSFMSALSEHGHAIVWAHGFVVMDSEKGLEQAKRAAAMLDRDRVPPKREKSPYTGARISLSLHDEDVVQTIRRFGSYTGLALVVDPSIHGVVSANLVNVPWDNAFEVIMRAHDLAYRMEGGVMQIAPRQSLQDKAFLVESIQLSHVRPSDFLSFAPLLSDLQLAADDRSSTLILRGGTDRVHHWARIFRNLDVP